MSNTSYASTASSSGAVPVVLAIGRLLLAFMFIYAGFGKLTNITGTAGWFGSLGFPVPTLVAILVGLLELVGGLAVLVGFKTRVAVGQWQQKNGDRITCMPDAAMVKSIH